MSENGSAAVRTSRRRRARTYLGFYLADVADEQALLDRLDTLQRRDGTSMSDLLKAACFEYVDRHYPGNPAVPLDHWTAGTPMSESAKEKLNGEEARKRVLAASRSVPDYEQMSNAELLAAYKSPRTTPGEHQVIAYLLKKRSIYPEPVVQ